MNWQPISTALKEGMAIQLWWPKEFHYPVTGCWNRGKFNNEPIGWAVLGWQLKTILRSEPEAWRPLPIPPAPTGDDHVIQG